jgi:hypothetical protein
VEDASVNMYNSQTEDKKMCFCIWILCSNNLSDAECARWKRLMYQLVEERVQIGNVRTEQNEKCLKQCENRVHVWSNARTEYMSEAMWEQSTNLYVQNTRGLCRTHILL